MKVPITLIEQQEKINAFVKTLEPQLQVVSASKHPNLVDISDVKISEDGVAFKASGSCWGSFEDWFDVTWEQLKDV